jgi:hypothetical protein
MPTMIPQPLTNPAKPTTSPTLHCTGHPFIEDFIGPDGQANPLTKGFSLAPGSTVHVSRYVDTAISSPTTDDYASVPAGLNMTYEVWHCQGLPHGWQPNQ